MLTFVAYKSFCKLTMSISCYIRNIFLQRYKTFCNIKRKRRTKSTFLFSYINYNYLFPNTEVGEDVAEEVVGADFAGDFAEVVHTFTYILRN